MFIEKLEPIDLGEPIYGRTIVGCAPKGATTSQLCLPFYRHFTATRFFRRTPNASGTDSWPKALSIFGRSNERLDHFGVDEIAVKLIQLRQPEVIAGVV